MRAPSLSKLFIASAVIATILLAISVIGIDAPPTRAAGENVISTPDGPGQVGQYASMVLDANGFPVVSYKSGFNSFKLMHCNDPFCAGGDESIESFSGAMAGSVDSTSLRLDANGFPVIAVGSPLTIVHCNDVNCAGGDESTTTPSTPNATGTHVSLVLDASGFPGVAFQGNTLLTNNSPIGVLRCDDANCSGSGETVNYIVHGTVGVPSLQLDADNLPVVAIFDRGTGGLLVAHCNDAACAGSDETFNSSEDSAAESVGDRPSLVLDANGFPVVSYLGAADFRVLRCNDPDCAGADDVVNEVIGSGSFLGDSSSLALDASGFPVASFGYPGIHVMHCDDANCAAGGNSIVVVDNDATRVNTGTSMQLDGNGFPSVAYFIPTNGGADGDLRILRCGDANCSVAASPTATNTPSPTNTSQPPTATLTPIATDTPADTATATNTVLPTATNTSTNTPVPATATHTYTPTGTPTNTPVPPTATHTNTPTNTAVPATATATDTPTNTPVPPTATHTNTPTNTAVPATATATDTPTNTPVPPTATHTNTPTNTAVPATATATDTPTNTAVPPTATDTNTPTSTPVPPTATGTPGGVKCADVNGDGRVNSGDILRIALMWVRGQYAASHDLNGDGKVDFGDIVVAAMQFNQRCRQ